MRPTFEQVKKMIDKMNPHKVSPVDMMMNLVISLRNTMKYGGPPDVHTVHSVSVHDVKQRLRTL